MFYYNSHSGKHNITLKRACREWINADCPDIYYQDGSRILYHDINGWSFNGHGLISVNEMAHFIHKSDKSFFKRYKIGNLDLCHKFLSSIKGGK